MARPWRIQYEDAVYHVSGRGNNRQEIFREDSDREDFLELLGQCCGRFNLEVFAFCLMTNHYHLFLRTPEARGQPGSGHALAERNLLDPFSASPSALRAFVPGPLPGGFGFGRGALADLEFLPASESGAGEAGRGSRGISLVQLSGLPPRPVEVSMAARARNPLGVWRQAGNLVEVVSA